MKTGWNRKQRHCPWGVLGVVALALVVIGLPVSQAYADGIGDTLVSTFGLHGYLENQEIFRSENFVKNYNIASIRNRIYLEPSGAIIENATVPSLLGLTPPLRNFSLDYDVVLRPGYEGVYDLNSDRFGNHTTGFSGIGYSYAFQTPPGTSTTAKALLQAFGYNVKRFKGVVARDFAFPMPVDPNARFIHYINGVFTECQHCSNVNVQERNLRFERNDNNMYYYPVREAYLDFHFDLYGGNLIRLGKQQVVWGKADFFRLQDIVNPVDFGQHFFIEPFSETRIPQLALWWQHRFGDILGLQDVAGNLVWNFDRFTPVGLGQGGTPWAVNFGDQKRAFAFSNGLFDAALCNGSATPGVCNPNHVNFGLPSEKYPDWRLRNSGIGMKWDFQLPYPAIRFALTDWWGINQTPVFKITQVNVVPTRATCDPSKFTITKGLPGQFGPGLGGLPFIATGPNWIKLHGMTPTYFLNNCTIGAGTPIYYHRNNTLGLSADYFEPYTGVVIRVESSWTHNALVNDTQSLDWTSTQDVLQYVVGFDRPHFIKFLNPDRTFFSSFQVYETYYPGAHSTNGSKDGIVTGVNDFTFTAFTQTHYYRDQIVPIIFAAFGTQGTDATIGGNTQWLINDHWSATVGFDAFLGKSHQMNVGQNAVFQAPTPSYPGGNPYSETIFAPAQMQAGGAERNVMDEFWTRLRYRF